MRDVMKFLRRQRVWLFVGVIVFLMYQTAVGEKRIHKGSYTFKSGSRGVTYRFEHAVHHLVNSIKPYLKGELTGNHKKTFELLVQLTNKEHLELGVLTMVNAALDAAGKFLDIVGDCTMLTKIADLTVKALQSDSVEDFVRKVAEDYVYKKFAGRNIKKEHKIAKGISDRAGKVAVKEITEKQKEMARSAYTELDQIYIKWERAVEGTDHDGVYAWASCRTKNFSVKVVRKLKGRIYTGKLYGRLTKVVVGKSKEDCEWLLEGERYAFWVGILPREDQPASPEEPRKPYPPPGRPTPREKIPGVPMLPNNLQSMKRDVVKTEREIMRLFRQLEQWMRSEQISSPEYKAKYNEYQRLVNKQKSYYPPYMSHVMRFITSESRKVQKEIRADVRKNWQSETVQKRISADILKKWQANCIGSYTRNPAVLKAAVTRSGDLSKGVTDRFSFSYAYRPPGELFKPVPPEDGIPLDPKLASLKQTVLKYETEILKLDRALKATERQRDLPAYKIKYKRYESLINKIKLPYRALMRELQVWPRNMAEKFAHTMHRGWDQKKWADNVFRYHSENPPIFRAMKVRAHKKAFDSGTPGKGWTIYSYNPPSPAPKKPLPPSQKGSDPDGPGGDAPGTPQAPDTKGLKKAMAALLMYTRQQSLMRFMQYVDRGFNGLDDTRNRHNYALLRTSVRDDFRILDGLRFQMFVRAMYIQKDRQKARVETRWSRRALLARTSQEWIVKHQASTLIFRGHAGATPGWKLFATEGDPLFGLANFRGMIRVDRGTLDGKRVREPFDVSVVGLTAAAVQRHTQPSPNPSQPKKPEEEGGVTLRAGQKINLLTGVITSTLR